MFDSFEFQVLRLMNQASISPFELKLICDKYAKSWRDLVDTVVAQSDIDEYVV